MTSQCDPTFSRCLFQCSTIAQRSPSYSAIPALDLTACLCSLRRPQTAQMTSSRVMADHMHASACRSSVPVYGVTTCGLTRRSTAKCIPTDPLANISTNISTAAFEPLRSVYVYVPGAYEAPKCIWISAARCDMKWDRGDGISVAVVVTTRNLPARPNITGGTK